MKTLLVVSLLVCGLMAVELEAGVPILLKEIKAIKSDNSEFKNLLDLELSQGTKLDEVVQMIGDLLEQMRQDQLQDDLEYAHRTTALGLEIEWLRIVLGNLTKERSARNQQLQDTIAEIVQLNQALENIQTQLDVLNTKEEEVRKTRAEEAAAYQTRSENNSRVLAALNEIIPKLTAAVFKEQGGAVLLETEKMEFVEKLRRELGFYHPVAVLVAVTSKFDVPTVTRIIEKLEHIRDAVIALQQQEDEREVIAKQSFQTAVEQFNELREKFSIDLDNTTSKLKKSTNDRILLEKRIATLNRDMLLTEKLLQETIEYKEQYDAAYAVRKAKRINEIKTVQTAYDLVDRHAKQKNQSQ